MHVHMMDDQASGHEQMRLPMHPGAGAPGSGTDGANGASGAADGPDASGEISRFSVRVNGRVTFVPAADVDYLEAARNYVRLHVNGQQFVIRATMQSLSARLDRKRFARVHKSTILNLERIREVQPWFGGDYIAILTSGERIKISRTYARSVLRPMQ